MKKTGTVLTIIVALTCVFIQQPAISQQSADDSPGDQEVKTLVAASNMLHPPFSSWDDNKVAVGIEVDIVERAAAKIGQPVKWIEKPFGELIDGLSKDEIDIAVSTIGVTDAREKQVLFSNPYFETQIVALVGTDSSFVSLESLAGARIGADKATTSFGAAKKRFPNSTLIGEVAAEMKWPQMIEKGLLDAFVVDASDQTRLETQSGVQLRRIVEPLATERFAIAMTRKADRLKSAIDEQIHEQRQTIKLRIGDEYQFTTLMGRKVNSLSAPPAKLVTDYVKAVQAYRAQPNNADATIWYGRRAGYLLRLNEAIQVFTAGIEKHPNDARFYRHRGHRFISIRKFDSAIRDLEFAVTLIEGKPNSVEPDGAPNPQGIELTTLHGNIWYHLGLAYYLKNDVVNSRRCFRECLRMASNDDGIVSASHWLYMALRRMDFDTGAAKLVKNIRPEMKIIENMTYHQMCLLYAGKIEESELLNSKNDQSDDYMRQSVSDVLLYGTGNWNHYHLEDEKKCRQYFEKLLANGSPLSFAFIAAEADYVRLFSKR